MKIIEDKTFKELATFRIGGKIKYYVEPKDYKEIEEAICFAKSNDLPIFIIGGGSDILASDNNFEGLVIKYIADKVSISGETVRVEAGMSWDNLVKYAVENNLQGIECLSGIPGTVGAAPVQNIGAYGQELRDVFVGLTAYDIENKKLMEFSKSDCKFGYRESVFKEKSHWQKFIIVEVTLKLNRGAKPKAVYDSLTELLGNNPSLEKMRNAVLKIRSEKLEDPAKVGNAGSFFKNPIISQEKKAEMESKYTDAKFFPFEDKYKIPAAWLIEKCGWKGKNFQGVTVSTKHALILINKNNAKAEEVLELSDKIIENVFATFNIKLEREVQLVNF